LEQPLSGSCFDFLKDGTFIVGTEEGQIYKCSKEYSTSFFTYSGHHMAIYSVRYNPFQPKYFLSGSADWTCKLWDTAKPNAVMTFDLGASVGDLAWAPYSSTVFAAVTSDGKAFVFDLSVNKQSPICEQQITKKDKLTSVRFNPVDPILLIGDERGVVHSLKLSPNLRKAGDEQVEKLQKVVDQVLGVSSLEIS
jgi:dynein intermediate chain 1